MTLAAITAGRVLAEALMLDTCTAVRPAAPSTNATTGSVTTSSTSLYSGKCKVQAGGLSSSTPEVSGRVATVERPSVHVPVGAWTPMVGDVITITAAQDAVMVGRLYRVAAIGLKSHATALRLGVEEVTA